MARRTPTTIQPGFVDIGSLRVHHMHGGRGSPVVFIHGLGSSGYMEWRFTLEPAAERHRVYAPDLPGYGRTEKPRARYTIPYFARFVERYIEDRGLRSVVLVGASPKMIRRVAGRYAGASSDLERSMDDVYLGNLREMYAGDDFHNAYLSTVRSLINPRSLLGGNHDVTARLNEIKIPLQLIWGADDPLFPVSHAARAHALVKHSRLAVIEGAGHSPQAERPEEFNRVLLKFIDS